MNGSSITKTSLDGDDRSIAPAPSRAVTYRCASGHAFDLRFAAEADEIPVEWDCRCGRVAETTASDAIDVPQPIRKPGKTPYEMLRERRSEAELQELLEERLAILRAEGGAPLTDPDGVDEAVPAAVRALAEAAA